VSYFNFLPSSDVVRKREINLRGFFSSVCLPFKTYHPYRNVKFNNLGISRSLKLGNLMGKILRISLQLNFTADTLSSYGLIHVGENRDILKNLDTIFICCIIIAQRQFANNQRKTNQKVRNISNIADSVASIGGVHGWE